MAGVLKQGKFSHVDGFKPDTFKTNEPLEQDKTPKRNVLKKGLTAVPIEDEISENGIITERDFSLADIEVVEEEPLQSREEVLREYEFLKQKLISEGLALKNEMLEEAKFVLEKAKVDAEKILEETNLKCAELQKTTEESAFKQGYDTGFTEGDARGYDEGYTKGLRKCKETLKELNEMLAKIPEEKDKMFKNYEHQLFDSIFTIANKITVDSLVQKDKAVISKMLKQAAKNFRNAEYIKITLSKLDVDDMTTAEMDVLREIFRDGQTVEFEISKESPRGTLILDDGMGITDASIPTQLKMIEGLGKGKFREKPPEDDEEDKDI